MLGVLLSFLLGIHAHEREVISLAHSSWSITLDEQAQWQHDSLCLPPVDVTRLPVNIPTGGWSLLDHPDTTGVTLPATVEGCLWGRRGDASGVNGNYVGVSWFVTKVNIPSSWARRHIVMRVGSVRFRAEIFVNRRLAGYDLVNSTPFDVDLTHFLVPGQENEIAFRITDPNGNFNWKDSQVFTWGDYLTNPSHGFGGITAPVTLIATDNVFIDDVFVMNKPTPTTIDIQTTVKNLNAENTRQPLTLEVCECPSGRRVYSLNDVADCAQGSTVLHYSISLPKARLWNVDSPNLYTLTVKVGDDAVTKRFGFRWFEVRTVDGDRQFYLNGKRIVLRTAISWGFWPHNGIAPTDSLAHRQIRVAKELGLNMLNFHRSLGQTAVFDAADELGLLLFEEPGGNQYPIGRFNNDDKQSRFYFAYRNEKLARMIRRDRSHPSLIIYNLHNERGAYPQAEDYREMHMGHSLDPSRIMTYNSSNGPTPDGPNARFKLHLLPNDTAFHDFGWWDRHHAGGPGVYHDAIYQSPTSYLRCSRHPQEIVYWGEEGAIGTLPRLELIRKEILASGQTSGWEASDYLKWYDVCNNFLHNRHFDKAFPTVDDLTKSIGNVAYYYQGRVIENIRMNNIVDGYAVNGWESMKLENHSGIVDCYRHPKGDVDLIARYNRPLYLAVKMNHKVLNVGDTTTVDVFIVNENDVKGSYTLRLRAIDDQGNVVASTKRRVSVAGGSTYGQLLTQGWKVAPTGEGYTRIEAVLEGHRQAITSGSDSLFAVRLTTEGISTEGMVADTSGVLGRFLKSMGIDLPSYRSGEPTGRYLVVGAFEPQQWGSGQSDLLNWVSRGNTLILIGNVERWAEYLGEKEVLDYRGYKQLGKSWYGGNFFNREHPFFKDLPANTAFNWEYQCFAAYNRRRIGLRDMNGDIIVGCVSDHKKEVYSALSVIPVGMGNVVITTLDIPSCIKDIPLDVSPVDADGLNESMATFNNSKANPANSVGKKLLLNMLEWASKQTDGRQ